MRHEGPDHSLYRCIVFNAYTTVLCAGKTAMNETDPIWLFWSLQQTLSSCPSSYNCGKCFGEVQAAVRYGTGRCNLLREGFVEEAGVRLSPER